MKPSPGAAANGQKNDLKDDPYAGMKVALAKTVLSGKSPSVAKLNTAFMEEFGEPPPPSLLEAFIRKLPPGRRPAPALRQIHHKINLIKNAARQTLPERFQRALEARGGGLVTLALEKEALDLLAPLKSVYGLESTEELVTMALKILEQQARGAAPELFQPQNRP